MEELRPIQFNKHQTQLTNDVIAKYPKEVIDDLYDYLNTVPYIQRLVDPDRKYAKDLERDDTGRIIVDLCNPHILENMDYFRETAIHFQKYGCYTKLKVNTHPQSEYMKWFRNELKRCWEGMVRPEDGEWITGDMYFFLNYSMMTQTITKTNKRGFTYGIRKDELPECWEGIYLRFHYLDQARYGGLYNSWMGQQHAAEIASRGKGKSYSLASILERCFTLGISQELCNNRKALIVADLKTYLTEDGTLNKFETGLDHLAKYTEFPQYKGRDSLTNMTWLCGDEDTDGINQGPQNLVIGQAIGDDPDKSRGKRSDWMLGEEFGKFGKFSNWWATSMPNVQEGEIVFGLGYMVGTGGTEGSDFTGALDMIYSPESNHIYGIPNVFDRGSMGNKKTIFFFPAYMNYKPYYDENGVSDVIGAMLSELMQRYDLKYNSSDPLKITKRKAEFAFTIQDAIMRRDSTVYPVADLNDRINQIDADSTSLRDMYVGNITLTNGEAKWLPSSDLYPILHYPHKDNKLEGCVYIKNQPVRDSSGKVPWGRYIAGCLLPDGKVMTNSGLKNSIDVTYADLLVNKEGKLVDINQLLEYDKVDEDVYTIKVANTYRTTTFTKEHPIYVSDRITKYNTKCDRQRQYEYNFDFKTVDKVREKQWIKVPNYYKEVKSNYTQLPFDKSLMLLPDFWWFIGLWLGDGWVDNRGNIYIAFNAKETKHIDRAKEFIKDYLFKSPHTRLRENCVELSFTYKELQEGILNTFGKYAIGKRVPECVKHLPHNFKWHLISGYLDSDGCITEACNGYYTHFVSINLELLEAVQDMLFSLGCVSSIKKLRDAKVTAVGNQKETYQLSLAHYDTLLLHSLGDASKSHKLSLIDTSKYKKRNSPRAFKCYIEGDYILFQIEKITKSLYTGKVYNFDCDTHTFMCHHITTHNCDPYDDDVSNTKSLGALYILDLWTDDIVAEYVGRPMFADDFYENCRRLLLYYNAECNYENNKKGIFGYFSKHNCLYLLADTLEFLKDKDSAKISYGNKAKGTANYSNVKAGGVSAAARRMCRDYLLKPFTWTEMEVIEGIETEVEKSVLNLFRIKYRALLQELAMWNADGNFDRHDALVMLMLIREDKLRLTGGDVKKAYGETSGDDLCEDDFFNNNYEGKTREDKWLTNLKKLGYFKESTEDY